MTDPKCENPAPTEFKANKVVTGLNAEFARQAPRLKAFFDKLSVPAPAIDAPLGWLENQGAEPEDAEKYFQRKYPARTIDAGGKRVYNREESWGAPYKKK